MKRYQIDEKDVAAPGGDHVEIRHGTHWSPVDVSCKFFNRFNHILKNMIWLEWKKVLIKFLQNEVLAIFFRSFISISIWKFSWFCTCKVTNSYSCSAEWKTCLDGLDPEVVGEEHTEDCDALVVVRTSHGSI